MTVGLSFTLIITVVAIGILVTYLAWRRLRFHLFNAILLIFFMTISIVKFYEADVVALLFTWFSMIMATSLAFDIISLLNKEINEKLAIALMLTVISGGGVLANVVIFPSSVDPWLKVFSLATLIAVHVPLLVGIIAYFVGKKLFSKRLVEEFYLSRQLRKNYKRGYVG